MGMNAKIFLLCGIAVVFNQCSPQTNPQEKIAINNKPGKLRIKVSDDWIEKVRANKYQADSPVTVSVLKEFEEYIKPDTLDGTAERVHYRGGVVNETDPGGRLNAVFVNLDEDAAEEMVGLFGYSRRDPSLGVFKKIDGAWYLVYLESFWLFSEDPELVIANNYSANKVFYIRKLHDRGSGIYADSYQFYKLINGTVYPCLELVSEAWLYGWGRTLNQKASSKFSFKSTTADELWVNYSYSFFAGSVEKGDMSWMAHEDIKFVHGEQGISYIWNKHTRTYQPDPVNWDDNLSDFRLTKDKITCFSQLGNDTLFVRAFAHELKETLKEGDSRQKKYLKKYLADVRKNGESYAEIGELKGDSRNSSKKK